MIQHRATLLVIVLGALGAGISVILLLISQTDVALTGVGNLIAEQLPVLVFVAGMGFGAGVLVATLWLITQRIFAPDAPRA